MSPHSPHVSVGRYLDDLQQPDHPAFYEVMVERCIIGHYTAGLFTEEEFHYYCERFRRLTTRELRRVA